MDRRLEKQVKEELEQMKNDEQLDFQNDSTANGDN